VTGFYFFAGAKPTKKAPAGNRGQSRNDDESMASPEVRGHTTKHLVGIPLALKFFANLPLANCAAALAIHRERVPLHRELSVIHQTEHITVVLIFPEDTILLLDY
jgi:hypothetical protein